MAFKVNRVQCETCIFGAKSPISRERFQELQHIWQRDNVVQECHQATIQDEHVGCRGHYEAARRNNSQHPIVDTAQVALGLYAMSTSDVMQVCERMGLVEFVEVNKTDE